MHLQIEKHMLDKLALYKITDIDGKLMSVNIVPFKQLTSYVDCADTVILQVIGIDEDIVKLANYAGSLFPDKVKELREIVGAAKSKRANGKKVKCLTTGETFKSMAQCCRAHSLNYSQLAKHLNGDRSYNAVKKRKYRRVE